MPCTAASAKGGEIAFCPKQANAGLIFYPGGKVRPEAYAPLLTECARQGILCVLVKPPFNMAILDANAAEGLQAQFPEIEKWLIGGHSLGGVAASTYLARHSDDFSAIAFLAAYPTEDLSKIDVEALSVVGSNDSVLDRAKYDEAMEKMPAHMRELVIPGGNHASFGNYGAQQNDSEATITREEQQALTAQAIADLAEAA